MLTQESFYRMWLLVVSVSAIKRQCYTTSNVSVPIKWVKKQ